MSLASPWVLLLGRLPVQSDQSGILGKGGLKGTGDEGV